MGRPGRIPSNAIARPFPHAWHFSKGRRWCQNIRACIKIYKVKTRSAAGIHAGGHVQAVPLDGGAVAVVHVAIGVVGIGAWKTAGDAGHRMRPGRAVSIAAGIRFGNDVLESIMALASDTDISRPRP